VSLTDLLQQQQQNFLEVFPGSILGN